MSLRGSPLEQKVYSTVIPSVKQKGYGIVSIRWMDGRRKTLQIMIEREDYKAITLSDCTTVSHLISAILDVEDFISDEYNLEISSPGIDRPLIKREDFVHYKGFEVKITMEETIYGRKRFKGRLKELKGEQDVNEYIILSCLSEEKGVGEVDVELPLASINTAKLVLNDELLAAANSDDYILEE